VGDIAVLDVDFQGQPRVVACGLLSGPAGIALVDPGPASSLAGLEAALDRAGFSLADVRAILVTHIHLDHSGAAGTIVRRNPAVQVLVHERGAPHVVKPDRLLRSAAHIYGDRMEPLWGEVAPVPSSHVHALKGGERLEIVGRPVDVAYTPGHAMHHVSYLDAGSGTAFTGDVGGMCIGRARLVVPPTPPPDIDVESWESSVMRIRAWQPQRLFITHFGLIDDPESHLDQLMARLRRLAARVRESLAIEGRDADRVAWFRRAVGADLREHLSEADAAEIERDVMLDNSWRGLARYWRRRNVEGRLDAQSG
jgi:glyoxylase-like metal-dependent hydrolase (beta-lactamase superfamily II)